MNEIDRAAEPTARPDDVCAQTDPADVELRTDLLRADDDDDDDDIAPYVLIEGDRASLLFLAELIAAVANDERDCGFQMSPHCAGQAFFDRSAELGIYVHRLPCLHPPGDADPAD